MFLVEQIHSKDNQSISKLQRYLLPLGFVSINYGLFGSVRALVQQIWIQGRKDTPTPEQVVATMSDIVLITIAGVCCLLVQILLRLKKPGEQPIWKIISASLAALQGGILIFVSVTFLAKYPPSLFMYSQGGVVAAFSAGLASVTGAVLVFLDAWLCSRTKEQQSLSKSQRAFEFSVLTLICYILIGGAIFMKIELWDYEKSIQFCMVTLLTIGYGNIVAKSFLGRLVMIFYTTIGLLVAGYYAVSFQELISEKHSTDNKNDDLNSESDIGEAAESEAGSRTSSTETNQSFFNTDDGFWNSKFAKRFLTTMKLIAWLSIWWFGVSAVFWSEEPGWTYLDALYFSFVTMTGYKIIN